MRFFDRTLATSSAVIIVLVAGIAMLLLVIVRFAPRNTKSPEGIYFKQVEQAYAHDTVGGTTPQETVTLFADALEAGDLERASLYFMLEKQKQMSMLFLEAARRGTLGELVLLARAARTGTAINDEMYELSIPNGDSAGFTIQLVRNRETRVWKIDSL